MQKKLLSLALASLFVASGAWATDGASSDPFPGANSTVGTNGQPLTSEAYCKDHDCYYTIGFQGNNRNDLVLSSDYHSNGGQRKIVIKDFRTKYPDVADKLSAYAKTDGADAGNDIGKLYVTWEGRIETGDKEKQTLGTLHFDLTKAGVPSTSPVAKIALPAGDSGSEAVFNTDGNGKFTLDVDASKKVGILTSELEKKNELPKTDKPANTSPDSSSAEAGVEGAHPPVNPTEPTGDRGTLPPSETNQPADSSSTASDDPHPGGSSTSGSVENHESGGETPTTSTTEPTTGKSDAGTAPSEGEHSNASEGSSTGTTVGGEAGTPSGHSTEDNTPSASESEVHQGGQPSGGEQAQPSTEQPPKNPETGKQGSQAGDESSGDKGQQDTQGEQTKPDDNKPVIEPPTKAPAVALDKTETEVLSSSIQSVGLWAAEMNSLDKRLGDLHFSQGQEGVWMRSYGGRYKADATIDEVTVKPKTDFLALQIGYDTAINDATRLGLALTYMHASSNLDNAKAKSHMIGLTGYATFMPTNNDYIDVVGKVAHLRNELAVSHYRQWAFSLSAEYGHRFAITDRFSLTPNAEVTLGHLSEGSFTVDNLKLKQRALTTLSTRAGVKLNYNYSTGTVGLSASVNHDFGRKIKIAAVGRNVPEQAINLSSGNFVVGLNGTQSLAKNMTVYYNLEKSFGGKLQLQWRTDVGFRFAF